MPKATLKKMEPRLRDERYVGYIDVNCMVNSNGIYPLEFTSRFGYPTISIQQEGMLTPIGEFFFRLAEGSHVRRRAHRGRHRHHDESRTEAGLQSRRKHHDPQHVLSQRHRGPPV